MKRTAILVIAATTTPVYVHYINTHWTRLIEWTNANTPHLDVFLLFEHGTDLKAFQHLDANIIQDPLADYGQLLDPEFQQLVIPGILSKTIHALEVLQDRYDVFFRTNLSSFVRAAAFDRFVQGMDDICYSGPSIWHDALRQQLLHIGAVGPDKSIKSLAELDDYPGNTFASGYGFFLNRDEARSLVQRKRQIRWDIVDDVSIGLMFPSCRLLHGFTLCVAPGKSAWELAASIRNSEASHVRLENFPLENGRALWEELRKFEIWQ